MSKQTRLAVGLALVGLAISTALFAYLEITNYSTLNPTQRWLSIALCPPALLFVRFIDAEPHTIEIAILWGVIGLINAGLYAIVGIFVGRLLWKPKPPIAS